MSVPSTPWQSPSSQSDSSQSGAQTPPPQGPVTPTPAPAPAQPSAPSAPAAPGQAASPQPTPPPYQGAPTGIPAAQPTGYQTAGTGQPYGAIPGAPGFTFAPQPGIIPLRPLSFSELFSGAFEALRANPKAMFLPALVAMLIIGIVNAVLFSGPVALLQGDLNDPVAPGEALMEAIDAMGDAFASGVVNSIGGTILTGLLIVTVSRSVLGRMATVSEAWERTKPRIWALIGQSLLIMLITSALTIALAIGVVLVAVAAMTGMSEFAPSDSATMTFGTIMGVVALMFVLIAASLVLGFYFQVRLCMAPAALILENVGVIDGFKRSWHLTKGQFWKTAGTLFVATMIVHIATSAVGGVLGAMSGAAAAAAPSVAWLVVSLVTIVSSVISGLVLPFTASISALLYIDARMRKEGLDVELRRACTA